MCFLWKTNGLNHQVQTNSLRDSIIVLFIFYSLYFYIVWYAAIHFQTGVRFLRDADELVIRIDLENRTKKKLLNLIFQPRVNESFKFREK